MSTEFIQGLGKVIVCYDEKEASIKKKEMEDELKAYWREEYIKENEEEESDSDIDINGIFRFGRHIHGNVVERCGFAVDSVFIQKIEIPL
jgi:allophanate hydrolase subunit 1